MVALIRKIGWLKEHRLLIKPQNYRLEIGRCILN